MFWAGTAMDANIYLLYENGLGRIGLVVGIFMMLMYYFDLYDSIVLSNRREVVTRLVGVLGCAFVTLSVLYYAFPEISLVGTTLWLGVAIVAVTVPAWRKLFFVLNRSARFSERAILYGDGPLALPLMEEIDSRSELGVRVVGFVGESTDTPAGVPRFDDDDLEEMVEQRNVRRIVITMGDRRGKLRVDQLLKLKTRGVYIQDGPEYYESITGKIPLDSLRLSWLLFSPGFHVRAALRLYKRMFSLTLGSLAIVITSPIMLLAAIAIRLNSKGPAIFRQTRVGEHGKLFTVFKFRSMFEGSDKISVIAGRAWRRARDASREVVAAHPHRRTAAAVQHRQGRYGLRRTAAVCARAGRRMRGADSVLPRALAGEAGSDRLGADQSRL